MHDHLYPRQGVMNKFISGLTLLLLLLSNSLSAQTGARVGIKGGYSMALQYGITPVDMEYTVNTFSRHALTGGFLIFYPITESFCIQQEYLYVMKGSRQDIGIPDQKVNTYVEYDINYFEIPVVFRYTFVHLGNFKIYGTCGYALSILLNGEVRIDGTVEVDGAEFYFTYSDKIEGIDVFDYSFVYGLGAFLVAHIFYISAFFRQPRFHGIRSLITLLIILYCAVMGYLLYPNLGEMLVPVTAYICVIMLLPP